MSNNIIIAIDHGYGRVKTAHGHFQAGVTAYDKEPIFTHNMLVYQGRYYIIGEEHKPFLASKIDDPDYYILTLAAIACELKFRGLTSASVHLAVGLPLTWVGQQKQAFREYHAQQRGQLEKDRINARIRADGYEPIHPKFETVKQQIRDAIDKAVAEARDEAEFMSILTKKHSISTHFKRGRYSFIHPEREKPITGRSLGKAYSREAILEKLLMNGQPVTEIRPELATLPRIFLIPSRLRLVVDLQTCVKAQQSRAYARKVELSNLQRMAQTVAWIQENGIGTMDKLASAKKEIDKRHQQMSSRLKQSESDLRLLNRKIRHVGRYYSNHKVYARYEQAGDKTRFRAERRSEIEAYEESARELKRLFPDGNYPSPKALKSAKAALMEQRDKLRTELKPLASQKRNLDIVWKNVRSILGTGHSIMAEQRSEPPRNGSRRREWEL